jgi:DNA-binding NtrC family response regulator
VSGNAGPHPLVEKYVQGTEQMGVLAAAMPEPRDPLVQAMVLLDEVRHAKRSYDDAMGFVRELNLADCDPNLHVLLIDLWAEAANDAKRYGEVRALTRRARSLVSRRTPPEIEVTVMILEALRINVGGNLRRREEILEAVLEVLSRSSPRYPLMLLNYCWSFATQGRGTEVADRLREIREHPGMRPMSKVVELVDCVETGKVERARVLISELGSPWSPAWEESRLARQRGAYRFVRGVLAFMGGNGTPEQAYEEMGLSDPRAPEYPGPAVDLGKLPRWVWVFDHLLRGRPEAALEQARAEVAEFGEAYVRETGLMPFNLIRCELASGHAEAARRCISRRLEIGNSSYLDGLFLARAQLLAGDRDAAAAHFGSALRAAERYGARGRLDFELRLACELSPADIAWLGMTAGRLPPGQGAAPADRQAATPPAQASLVGISAALEEVRVAVARFAPLDVPVLIRGETGVGKEMVARALHEQSPRAKEPFIAVNCGAIAETLLESELFGHERGAFTGASRARRGIFEEAGGGTVLLDEIGEISPRLQVMLLRFLETGEIRRVGSSTSRTVACRTLAATNAELEDMTEEGAFRRDLLFRLKRLEIRIAPLRGRPEDILPLTGHFLAEGRADGRRPRLSASLREWLMQQQWPGNVRELKNLIERLRLLNSEKVEYHLADVSVPGSAGGPAGPAAPEAAQAPRPRDEDPAGAEPAAAPDGDERSFLTLGRSPMRRRDRLRALFSRHGKLTRKEIAALLRVSTDTVTRDLRALVAEGLIEKVKPSASPRSHYFRLRD